MSVCHTCHEWFQTLCVYQVCLSCLSVTRVTNGFRRCVYIRCVYHVCLSHVSRLVSDVVCISGVSIMSVTRFTNSFRCCVYIRCGYHVCLSHVSRLVSDAVCIPGVSIMSVCHTCHAWFQTLCVYQVRLSCLSVTRVTPGFRRCVSAWPVCPGLPSRPTSSSWSTSTPVFTSWRWPTTKTRR